MEQTSTRRRALPKQQNTSSKSHPYVVQKVRLHSLHAQQVFSRGFDTCANGVYALSVILRALSTEDQARELEGLIDERFNKDAADLRDEITRLEKLGESEGISTEGIQYSSPLDAEARISSPRANRYIAIVRDYDRLVAKLDALWLAGVIQDGDHSRRIYEWKRRILRTALYVKSLAGKAINQARRNGVEVAVEASATAGTADTESIF
jgi:hypothetical protein